jgi:CotS family spore coat protein
MSNLINKIFYNELNEKEKKLLQCVTEKYDFKVCNLGKVRSAYRVETDKGTICIKNINHGKHKVSNGNLLVKGLIENNFLNTSKYICTKDGHLVVTINNLFFYATEWINGEECDLGIINEVENCSKLLAEFHLATNKIDTSKLTIKNNLKNWPKLFGSNLNDLEKFKRVIEKKKLKSEFDTTYLSYIDSYYTRGMSLLKLLNESDYNKLSNAANENKTICHDSFYYQNIIKMEDTYYIIDLDSIMIDLQINDLGKFIRRLMHKSEYQWSFEKALLIMNAYESINKLTKSEYEAMIALILFPHKFWKLGKKRYTKNQNWDERKYLHKLNKVIKYSEAEEKFLNEYMEYINNVF